MCTRAPDSSIAAAEEPGGVALDFLVAENPPLTFYAQISNTGSKQTDRVRERFGLIHTQLTNNDDVLALDFVTAGFDDEVEGEDEDRSLLRKDDLDRFIFHLGRHPGRRVDVSIAAA